MRAPPPILALLAAVTLLAACGGSETDPCDAYAQCAMEVLVGCSSPEFAADCVDLSLAACKEFQIACPDLGPGVPHPPT